MCLLAIVVLTGTSGTAQPAAGTAPLDASLLEPLRWRNVGPARGGRVTAVAGVRAQRCTFYMGATGGGVWKTENCGLDWRPVSDGQIATGSIGAIGVAESRPEVVYVGTGSAAIRSNVIIGRGMYRSPDAGETWSFIGLRDAGQIGSVVVHPANPDVVWVAALGSPYGPTDARGVFKTTDGGRTWRRVLFVNRETGARVIAINRSNPDELYAGMYRAFRKGWDIVSGGPASEGGIYRSRDGGETWTRLSTGLPQRLIGRIDIDVAQSDPSTVFAMIEAPGQEGGLYQSTDAGASWRLVNNDARYRARPFYFHYVDVNPRDAQEVWLSELRLWRSRDGGRTFTEVPTPHVDSHGIWFNPDDPQVAVTCNDGGANVTQDGGRSWSSSLNQPTAEFYMVAVDEQVPYRLYGPQQDNSTVVVPSLPPVSWRLDRPEQLWGRGPGCETGQIHPRPDGQVIYGACKGEFGRYHVATGQEQHYWVYPQDRYGHHPRDIRFRFPRQTVIVLSPHDPTVVYQASHVVHRTTDEGVTWKVISPDLTANEPDKQVVPGTPITRDITGEEVYSSIYAMAESRLERGVLWAGANDGPVHVSRDGGATWTNVTPRDLPPGGRVQTIEDSPHRRGSAYIAVYRYLREHDLRPYIYRTDDYGRTWARLTNGDNGIPVDHPARVVREDPEVPGLLYAGTEFGIFVSPDDGRTWQPLQRNLPATPVTDIRVHRGDLVIATMGRSFWIMDDLSPLRQIVRARGGPAVTAADGRDTRAASARAIPPDAGAFDASRPHLFAPMPVYRLRYVPVQGRGAWPEYSPAGARLDYYLPGRSDAAVRLEILDASGASVRTFVADPQNEASRVATTADRGGRTSTSLPVEAGVNRFLWDLRHEGPWSADAIGRAAGGPLVAPGVYQVRLSVGDVVTTRNLAVRLDPRVEQDGVTAEDVRAQTAFLLKVRDAITEARRLAATIDEVLGEAPAGGAARFRAAGPTDALASLRARLVTGPGPYPRPMLIDQLANIATMLGQADQKVGHDAIERFDDLRREWADVAREAERHLER